MVGPSSSDASSDGRCHSPTSRRRPRRRGRSSRSSRSSANFVDDTLKQIRSRNSSEDSSAGYDNGRRLSTEEIDNILGEIRSRSRSRPRPPPPTHNPPSLPKDGAGLDLPFGPSPDPPPRGRKKVRINVSVKNNSVKQPKKNNVPLNFDNLRSDPQSWNCNPLFQEKEKPKEMSWNSNPVYEEAKPFGSSTSSSSSSSSPTVSAPPAVQPEVLIGAGGRDNKPRDAVEKSPPLSGDHRGKNLNESLSRGKAEAGLGSGSHSSGNGADDDDDEALHMVRQLKERLRNMSDELDRVKIAAGKIDGEMRSGGPEKENEQPGYIVEEPEDIQQQRRVHQPPREGLRITEVTSPPPPSAPLPPTPPSPRSSCAVGGRRRRSRSRGGGQRPHSLWEGRDIDGIGDRRNVRGVDLLSRRYCTP